MMINQETKTEAILGDNTLTPTTKAEALSALILKSGCDIDLFIALAKKAADVRKGILMEAFEFATRKDATIATSALFKFVSGCLHYEATRIKSESARVIANIAHLYPGKSDLATPHLQTNAVHSSTVVRWASATALSSILVTRHPKTKALVPAVTQLMQQEENNAIKKIYAKALSQLRG